MELDRRGFLKLGGLVFVSELLRPVEKVVAQESRPSKILLPGAPLVFGGDFVSNNVEVLQPRTSAFSDQLIPVSINPDWILRAMGAGIQVVGGRCEVKWTHGVYTNEGQAFRDQARIVCDAEVDLNLAADALAQDPEFKWAMEGDGGKTSDQLRVLADTILTEALVKKQEAAEAVPVNTPVSPTSVPATLPEDGSMRMEFSVLPENSKRVQVPGGDSVSLKNLGEFASNNNVTLGVGPDGKVTAKCGQGCNWEGFVGEIFPDQQPTLPAPSSTPEPTTTSAIRATATAIMSATIGPLPTAMIIDGGAGVNKKVGIWLAVGSAVAAGVGIVVGMAKWFSWSNRPEESEEDIDAPQPVVVQQPVVVVQQSGRTDPLYHPIVQDVVIDNQIRGGPDTFSNDLAHYQAQRGKIAEQEHYRNRNRDLPPGEPGAANSAGKHIIDL